MPPPQWEPIPGVNVSQVPFRLDGWQYGEDKIFDLAQRVRAIAPHHHIYAGHGGKAFGLSIAQAIADGVFWVPPWRALSSIDEEAVPSRWTMVRSNAMDEDWVSPDSGAHESKLAYSQARMRELVEEMLPKCEAVVVQSFVSGVGLVIDLGWSELLHRNVLRVAIGIPSRQGDGYIYTSPTWDNEAAVGVFDAVTGEAIVNLNPHYFDVMRIVDKMVHRIIPRLIDWGITFGLQFEFVGSLTDPENDALVQVRPSPGDLRGAVPKEPTDGHQLLATTGKVNRPGEAKGKTIWVNGMNDRRPPKPLYSQIGDVGRSELYNDGGLNHEFEGNIVVWNYDALQRYGYSLWQVLGAWKVGAIAQIASRGLFLNSAHGTSIELWHRDPEEIEAFRRAKTAGPTFCIDQDVLRELVRACHTTPITLHVVSDGLVGQVYKL